MHRWGTAPPERLKNTEFGALIERKVAQKCHGRTYFLTAQLCFSWQNLLFHSKTDFFKAIFSSMVKFDSSRANRGRTFTKANKDR